MNCPKCGAQMRKNGTYKTATGIGQQWICKSCGKTQYESVVKEIEQKETPNGLTEAQLRGKYDIKFIVNKKLNDLKPGVFIPECDFLKFCEIRPQGGYRIVIDSPDLQKYKGKAGGVTYWSTAESIAKMKREGILS